ncbi:MAG: S8 family serine peptidase [Candidatus Micrarchaeota archaeon]
MRKNAKKERIKRLKDTVLLKTMPSQLSQPFMRITIIALAALIIISLFLTGFPQFGQAIPKNTGSASPNQLLPNPVENPQSNSRPPNSLQSDSANPELVYWTEQSGNQTVLKGVFPKGAYFTRIANQQEIYKNQTVEAGEIITQKTDKLASVVPNEYIITLGPSIIEKKIELEKNKATSEQITSELTAYKQVLETQQNQARQTLTQYAGVQIKNSYKLVFNGFAVKIPKEQLEFVKNNSFKISPNYIAHTNLMDSVPLIHADDVWKINAQGQTCSTKCIPTKIPTENSSNTPTGISETENQSPLTGNSILPSKPIPATACPRNTIRTNDCLTGQGIKIGIIDTGVDYTHPDLGGCFGTGCKVIGGYDFVNNDLDPMDDMGHGTHVAATAAGNGTLKGVAPEATIYSYKVCDSYGSCPYSAILNGIEYSTDPNQNGDTSDHLDVINLSLGGEGNPDDELSQAIDNAVNAGVIAAIAAGNSGSSEQTIGSPGTARNAITVGAVDKQKNMAYFSSRGPVIWTNENNETVSLVKPDIVAPGVSICAAQWDNAWSSNECLDDQHVAISGTSMATPHTAGLAALVKQAHPGWSPLQVKTAIKKTAELLPASEKITSQGTGLVNALQAVRLQKALEVQLDPLPQDQNTFNITGRIAGTDFTRYTLAIAIEKNLNEYSESDWDTITESTQIPSNGILMENFSTLTLPQGRYLLRLQAIEDSNNSFNDYGIFKIERFQFIEPMEGDILNPNKTTQIAIENTNNLEIQNFVVQYQVPPSDWTSQSVTTNPANLSATIAPGFMTEKGTVKIRALITFVPGLTDSLQLDYLYSDPALKNNWPVHIPNEIFTDWGETYPIWPGLIEPVIGNVTGDANLEYAVYTGGHPPKIKIFNESGTLLSVISVGTNDGQGSNLQHPLLIDLDNDGLDELVVGDYYDDYIQPEQAYSKIFAFNSDGTLVNGWPMTLPFDYKNNLAAADLDRDGSIEIIVKGNLNPYGNELVTVLSSTGTILSQWGLPHSNLFGSISGVPAMGNFDDDPDLEIVVSTADSFFDGQQWVNNGILGVYNRNGTPVNGWPITLPGFALSSPVVGDLQNDGMQEIIIGLLYNSDTFPDNQFGGIHAFNRQGQELPGWPQQMGKKYQSTPALFDLDGDRHLEIVASNLSQYTHIFNSNGETLPGWPKYTSWRDYYSPVVGSLNQGNKALATTAGSWTFGGGGVYGWTFTGETLDGFPLFTDVDAQAPAVIVDLDRDSKVEIAASSNWDYNPQTHMDKFRGSLYVWDTDSPFVSENQQWPRFHHDKQLTGCYDCEETQAPPTPTFNVTFGGSKPDRAYFAQQTADFGYIAIGTTQPNDADVDAWLIKLQPNGTMDWNKTFGGTQYDYAEELVQTNDNGYLLAGYTKSSGAGNFDAWLVKTDSFGNQQWQKTFGGTGDDRFKSIQKTSDGGYILAGFTKSFGSQGSDLWIIKTNSQGNTCNYGTTGNCTDTNNHTFALRLSRSGDNEGTQIKATPNGYIISGDTTQNMVDAWLVKINLQGVFQWEKTFGTTSMSEIAYSVDTTTDGGYVLAAVFGLGGGQGAAWLIKTDSTGNQQWQKTFGTSGDNRAYFVQQTPDNGYILTGQKSGNGTDLWLIKTNSLGNMDWNKNYGGSYTDYGMSVQNTNDNGYIIASQKSITSNNTDFWILKTDEQGNTAP